MVTKSLYFLPAWQKAKRNLNHFVLHSCLNVGMFYCHNRCGHNAVCVNEDLIIWGGYSYEWNEHEATATFCEKDALWVYNMDNDFWASVETTGESPLFRSGAVSVLVWPYWYIIAGHTYEGDVNDIHALNLITLVWEKVVTSGTANLSRRDKASAWLWENRIYCFGGYGPNPKADLWEPEQDTYVLEWATSRGWNNQVVYLDTTTKEWVRPDCKGPKPLARAAHSSTIVGNSVYVFGGRHKTERMNDLHRLHLESHTWSGSIMCLGESPCGRSWHSMAKAGGSNLLLFGGFSTNNVPLEDSWLLNIETRSWSVLTRKTGLPRLYHTSCVNSYGDVLVFGGCMTDIADDKIPMETSNQVVFFKTQPFRLQRLCLHALFIQRRKTEHLWEQLPKMFYEWLRNRSTFSSLVTPDYFMNTVEHGWGPSLSALSVMSAEEAERLNIELHKDEWDDEEFDSDDVPYLV